MKFDLERMCRINGKRPTARDRWVACYRMWRIARRLKDHGLLEQAEDCLRVLEPRAFVALLNEEDSMPYSKYPVFIRKMKVESMRRKNCCGDRYQHVELNQRLASKLREEGTEVTPDEVGVARKKVMSKIRQVAATLGIQHAPGEAGDEQLMRILRQARREKETG